MKLFRNISFGLTGILILFMTAATVLEKIYGTDFAVTHVYGSTVFIVCWGATAISAAVYLLRRKAKPSVITLMLHASFILILCGAAVTHYLGQQGSVHLTQDTPVRTFVLPDGKNETFPFQLTLKDFQLEYYMGTFAPMDYVSTIIIQDENGRREGEVSMNHIYHYKSYRFYQSKYDKDGKGVTLSVSHDPYGIGITYTGYALLLCCLTAFFFQKQSRFRQLLRHPLLRKTAVACLLLLPFSHISGATPQALPARVASRFCDLYVYYNDRICPLQTLAKDFTLKIYGKPEYKGLTPEQVLTGWFFYYDDWKTEPMILIKGKDAQSLLGINGKYARLTDFIGIEGYKLEKALSGNDEQASRANIERANEKFNLISMASTGSLFKIYPYPGGEHNQIVWYSLADKLPSSMSEEQWIFIKSSMNYVAEKVAQKNDKETLTLLEKIKKYQRKEAGGILPSNTRFNAEKTYNQLSYNKTAAMLCLTVGILSFIVFCLRMMAEKGGKNRWTLPLNILLALVFAYLTVVISLRGYVSNHLPLSNGFETMQFMAWCSVLLTFFLQRKFSMAQPFGFLLCGLTLLVSMMGESNPQITQLMPVLNSPLLSIHVVVIMLAYSLLAFTMLNGVTAVVLHFSKKDCRPQIERLQIISNIILYPAVFLLTIGIFVGAVWANVSWGRYWGWDPKEVWALITMLVYALALHPSSLPLFRKPMFFHVFCIAAFLTVLITYFGVNFLLGGMHSYANS